MNFNGNWVDLTILLVLLYFLSQAWSHGLWVLLAEFLSFLGSLIISLRLYTYISELLTLNFDLSRSTADAIGFLACAIVLESVLGYILINSFTKLPDKFWKGNLQRFLGLIPALGQGLVLISFVLTLALVLPLQPSLKTDISESQIGGYLLNRTSGVERNLKKVFGGVIEDSITYLTVKPESDESIPLEITKVELSIDERAETDMFRLVNEERAKAGVGQLVWNSQVVPVAREHARDMWERKYFSHISPEGEDVGDRLDRHNINYFYAGENLALAPTTQTAHNGLMNSEGHRRNILEPQFRSVGIGVIDNGVYGKIFVQVFTD